MNDELEIFLRRERRILYDIAVELMEFTKQYLQELEEKAGYNPNQLRVPAGSREGGRWTRVGGENGNAATNEEDYGEFLLADSGEIVSDAGRSYTNHLNEDEEISSLMQEVGLELIGIIPQVRLIRVLRQIALAIRASRSSNISWKLGKYKSAQRWANQMEKRGWTPEQISEILANGKRSSVENRVNRGNSATKYKVIDKNGNVRFAVRDDKTSEILQISGKDFKE